MDTYPLHSLSGSGYSEASGGGESGAAELLLPLPNKSVVDRIIERLTQAILNRELRPGQKIPTEVELCESLQVGRNSVREAIKVLITMGVLEIRRSEGTYVTEGFSERMLDPMIYGLILESGDSFSVIELRTLLETGILHLAIEKRNSDDLQSLRDCLERMRFLATERPRSVDDLLAVDVDFHRLLSQMVKNPLLTKIYTVIERLTLPARVLTIRRYVDREEQNLFIGLHQELYQVVEDRDVAAANRVMDEHFAHWRRMSSRLQIGGDSREARDADGGSASSE